MPVVSRGLRYARVINLSQGDLKAATPKEYCYFLGFGGRGIRTGVVRL